MNTTITLGGIALEAFEIPAAISFGGSQRMAVHDMPGGGRVIDLLGAVADDIVFAGIISGLDAEARARFLDTMRISGATQILSWDGQYFTVILRDAQFDYAKPWWIPYRLRCIAQAEFTSPQTADTVSAAAGITTDLANAAGFLSGLAIPIAGAQSALSTPGAQTFGTLAYAQGLAGLTNVQSAVGAAIAGAGLLVDGIDLGFGGPETGVAITSATASAGSLAALSFAQGSLGQALSTLRTIGT